MYNITGYHGTIRLIFKNRYLVIKLAREVLHLQIISFLTYKVRLTDRSDRRI